MIRDIGQVYPYSLSEIDDMDWDDLTRLHEFAAEQIVFDAKMKAEEIKALLSPYTSKDPDE